MVDITDLTESFVGGSCNSSSDCFNGMACLGGICCAFSNSSMAPSYQWNGTGYSYMDTGTTNCAVCNNASRTSSYYGPTSNVQYQCSACKAGSQLVDYFSGGFQCQSTCDPVTEYRSNWASLTCSNKHSAGSSCSSSSSSSSSSSTTGDSTCLSGRCGGSYCCSQAATAESCGRCESTSGACFNISQDLPFSDDFEATELNSCWRNGPAGADGATFEWSRGSGQTSSYNTGPSAAHSGSTYFYMEATSQQVRPGIIHVIWCE